MGSILKGAGDLVDPMTGQVQPLGLILPQVRENNRLKRTMMEEEIKTDQTRRRALQFDRNQDVLQTAEKTGKPVSKGQLLAMRRETVLSAGGGQEGRIEARASGLGRGDIRAKLEDFDEGQRKLIAAKAALREDSEKMGYKNLGPLIDLFGLEEAKHAGLAKYEYTANAASQIGVAREKLKFAKDEAAAKDIIARAYSDHVMDNTIKTQLNSAYLKNESFLQREYAKGLNRIEDYDYFTKKKRFTARIKRRENREKGPDSKDISNADRETIMSDLLWAGREIDPESVPLNAEGAPQPSVPTANMFNRTTDLVSDILEHGGGRAASMAAGRAALAHQAGRGPFYVPSPLKKRTSRLFNNFIVGGVIPNTGAYTSSEEDLNTAATAFEQRLEDQRLMRADAVTKKYAVPGVDVAPEAFFLAINRSIQESGIPAEVRRDPTDGRVKFMPKEGFEQSDIPLEFLDQLSQILYDFFNRDSETAAPDRGRRANAG